MNNHKLTVRPCVAVFLYTEDGRFLLAEKNRPHNRWQIAQGGVEEGESHAEGARREMREELGLELSHLTPTSLTYIYEWPEVQKKLRGFWGQEVHFFLAKLPTDQKIKYNAADPKEPQNSKLVTLAEAEKLIENPAYFQIIQKLHAQAHQA